MTATIRHDGAGRPAAGPRRDGHRGSGLRAAGVLVATAAAVLPLAAEEARPAPDYFIDMVLASTTAQRLALACPTLSFELLRASRDSEAVLQRLIADGFDPARLDAQMADDAERFAAGQAAFLERHGLAEGADAAAVCAAGRAEIAADTAIGRYLTEVDG